MALTDDGYNVGQHVIAADLVECGQVGETGRLNLAPVRLGRSVRHQVDSEFTCAIHNISFVKK